MLQRRKMHKLFENVKTTYNNRISVVSYHKNDIIFNESDYCHSIGLVIKGNIQINTLTYIGNEYNITYLSKNDYFGATLIFTDHPYYLGDVISMTESEVIFIKKSDLLYLMQHDLTFLNNFLKMSNNAHINNQKRIKVLIQKSIRDKILFHLYEEAKVRKVNIIPIASKAQLATFLNIPRPSLSQIGRAHV